MLWPRRILSRLDLPGYGLLLLIGIAPFSNNISITNWGIFNDIANELYYSEVVLYALVVTYSGRMLGAASRPSAMPGRQALMLYAICLVITLITSAVWNTSPAYMFSESFSFMRQALAATILPYFLVSGVARDRRNVSVLMLGSLLVYAAIGLMILKGDYNAASALITREEEGIRTGQISFAFGLEVAVGGNTMALYFLTCLIVSWSLFLTRASLLLRLVGFGLVLLSAALQFALATRGTLMMALPALAAVTVISWRHGKQGHGAQTVGIAAVGLAAIGYYVLTHWETLVGPYQANRLSLLLLGEGGDTGTLSYRSAQYGDYLSLVLDYPFGYGFMEHYPGTEMQPHSLFLRLVLCSGFVGFVAYLAFFYRAMRFWWNSVPFLDQNAVWAPVGMVVAVAAIFLMGWGYDFYGRFPLQLSFMLWVSLTTAMCRLSVRQAGMAAAGPVRSAAPNRAG